MSKAKKMGKGVDALFEQEKLAKRREADARRKREKRAALKDAIGLVASEIAKPPSERVKLIDEPAPVRLSLVSLADTFTMACGALALADQAIAEALDARTKALGARGRAREALDAEIARLEIG